MRFTPRLMVWALLTSLTLGWITGAVVTASSTVEALEALDSAASPNALSANLITNTSFEGAEGWQPAAGNASGFVAPGWHNWFRLGPDANIGLIRAPEWLPEDIWAQRSHMVYHGERSQKIFSTSATHDAGNWQTVSGLQPGQVIEFSVWVKVWTSDCGDACYSPTEPCRVGSSNSNGNYDVAVGIDPTGATPQVPGTPPASVVWSPWVRQYDKFYQMKVRTIAQSDHVTVYTRGAAEWRVQNNFSFWDDASLTVVDDTLTPTPTGTTYLTVTAQPTSTRTPTATVGPTQTPAPTVTTGPQLPRAYLPLIQKAGEPSVAPTATATAQPTATTAAPPTATQTAIPLTATATATVGSSRVDLQACKLEYSIVSPK